MPLLTSTHAFIHIPKTGGSHVKRVLKAHGGTSFHRPVGAHKPASRLPIEMWEGRTVVATVRDPWTWYAAWYAHCMRSGANKSVRKYGLNFRSVLGHLTGHLNHVVQEPSRRSILWGPNKPFGASCPWYDPETEGFATWAVKWTHQINGMELGGLWKPDILMATDRLDEALIELGLTNTTHEPYNPNPKLPTVREQGWWDRYADWYDEEMVEWVYEADKYVIDLFGWRYGEAQAQTPTREPR